MSTRVFLLSPAHCGGQRAQLVLRKQARFDLARRVQSGQGASLGEVFSFMSGLYFRGKLAYARSFARPPAGLNGTLVITPCQGFRPPEIPVARRFCAGMVGSISIPHDRVTGGHWCVTRAPWRRPSTAPSRWQVVLLGSVASREVRRAPDGRSSASGCLPGRVRRPGRHEPRRLAASLRGRWPRTGLRAPDWGPPVRPAPRPPVTPERHSREGRPERPTGRGLRAVIDASHGRPRTSDALWPAYRRTSGAAGACPRREYRSADAAEAMRLEPLVRTLTSDGPSRLGAGAATFREADRTVREPVARAGGLDPVEPRRP